MSLRPRPSLSNLELRGSQDDPRFDPIFSCIGRFVAAWGHLEQGLDAVNRIARSGTQSPPEPDIPQSMRGKIRYFRESTKIIADPKVRLAYRQICRWLLHHVGARNDVVHGHIIAIDADGSAVQFGRFDPSHSSAPPRTYTYSMEQLLKGTSDARAMARILTRVVRHYQEHGEW